MTKNSKTTAISLNCCAENKLQVSFSRCVNAVKNVHFHSFHSLHQCMNHNYNVTSGKHIQYSEVVCDIILLQSSGHTTYHSMQVLVVIRFNVILLPY